MAKKRQTEQPPSRKSISSLDDLTKTTQGGIELTESELGRVSGGIGKQDTTNWK